MARTPCRSIRLRLHQDRQGVRRHGPVEHRSLYSSHFSVVRKAAGGVHLFSNDPAWAARVSHPDSGPDKTYHVQIDRLPDEALLARLERGMLIDGESLAVKSARLLRSGQKHAWLEIVLDEGRNRQIRRLLKAFDIAALRLVRVRVGKLPLGELPKGQWRVLTDQEIDMLAPADA